MLRDRFQQLWANMQPAILRDSLDLVIFRLGINMLEQSEDPFRERKPREDNALGRMIIKLHDIYTEVVTLQGAELYYGIHHSSLSMGQSRWCCATRLTKGDRLWNILQEVDRWQLSFLSPASVENLVNAERDAAGDFMEDSVWKLVRADDNTTYIITQEG